MQVCFFKIFKKYTGVPFLNFQKMCRCAFVKKFEKMCRCASRPAATPSPSSPPSLRNSNMSTDLHPSRVFLGGRGVGQLVGQLPSQLVGQLVGGWVN